MTRTKIKIEVATIRELTLDEVTFVSGGAKGDSGALDAAKKIDLSAFLAKMDAAIAKAKQI